MSWLLELDVGSRWLFSHSMLYHDAAMLCFDSLACCVVGILSVSILVHKIVGSHSVSDMTIVLLGDVGGDKRQF